MMPQWNFLFQAMAAMGIPQGFIDMVTLLFKDASACVKVNGNLSTSFKIERGVRQGCPLAPYLFIILADVLNIMVQTEATRGRIRGISLLVEGKQQILAQYADDASFTLLGEEGSVRNLILSLDTFCIASGLVINWNKSSGHWECKDSLFRPPWTDYLGIKWADDNEVGKLLGAPFGMTLTSGDIDNFLYEKTTKKLTHWSKEKINPSGRAVVVNTVLLSTMFFFLSVWGGTNKGVKRVKSLAMNYLSGGTMQRARTKVSWLQCCQPKERGGLDLVNPEGAMVSLMTKWVVKALEPGDSNLHLLLRARLSSYQPYKGGRWEAGLEFFTLKTHQCKRGSLVWNRVTSAWKSIRPEITYIRPSNLEELLSSSLWFCPSYSIIGLCFSKSRATILHKKGMRYYRDVWTHTRFMTCSELQDRYGLLPGEFGAWSTTAQALMRQWADILRGQTPRMTSGEWFGVFSNVNDLAPMVVCLACDSFQPCTGYYTVEIPWKTAMYVPSHNTSAYLLSIPEEKRKLTAVNDSLGEDLVNKCKGLVRRVRVTMIKRGPRKKKSYCTMVE